MDIRENIRIAIFSIKTNMMRSLLTMLGIIIGVASVISIITIGNGGRDYIVGMIEDMGSNAIQISVNANTANQSNYITEEDISEARIFEDRVGEDASFNFDVQNISGAGLDKTGVQHKFTQKNGYTIPYGCLVPEKIDGLILSGRNISGTHMAHSNFRAMPICLAIGCGAGAAASVAVKDNVEVRDVDVKKIQEILF